MTRENRFVIRLTPAERQQIETLARAEKMAASTLARNRLLFEAERRGIYAQPEKNKSGAMDSDARRAASVEQSAV